MASTGFGKLGSSEWPRYWRLIVWVWQIYLAYKYWLTSDDWILLWLKSLCFYSTVPPSVLTFKKSLCVLALKITKSSANFLKVLLCNKPWTDHFQKILRSCREMCPEQTRKYGGKFPKFPIATRVTRMGQHFWERLSSENYLIVYTILRVRTMT